MEINTDEIFDPEHLSGEEYDCVRRMAEARNAGIEDSVDDDPIARGLVNGHILQTIGQWEVETGHEGKNLLDVTQKGPVSGVDMQKELTPEEIDQYLGEFLLRFDALPQLHKGIKWADIVKSLKADPESMAKLQALDEKGHKMSVFGEENGEFIFASGWDNYEQVSPEHRNITYDLEGQKLAEKHGHKPNGNAVSIIAKIMGVKEDEAGNYLADPKFHEQLRKAITVNGYAWLKTDAATRKSGGAFGGSVRGVVRGSVRDLSASGSFRAALRVKKA